MSVVSFAFDVLAYSAIFILVVMGLGVIASMMGIFNFAHGEFVLLGAYTVYLFQERGLPVWAGMLAAPFAVAVVGLLLERTVIRRFYAAPVAAMLGTYAIGLSLREGVRGLLAGQFYSVISPLVGSFDLGDISVSKWKAAVILMTLLVMVGSWLLLTRTRFGLQVRATLENPALARASGISTDKIYAATFSFGAALAGLAGGLMVPIYSLNADMGVPFLIKSFLAVMLGGAGGFEGSMAGAAFVGASSAALPWVIKPVVADVLVFVIAIAIVKFRPEGLLSRWRSS
ncbi:MAG TPA: branched-chain amino acid ABC transporter permease [Burkholderiales bacterium]|jgi:branched-chain amino acid transport system permease protein|nr:branched-chain amino acid ABC transporter permease [Burkholderiales bacterium]